jgi:excisionase family DNA binding protein
MTDLLTVTEAARTLKISGQRIRQLIKAGRLASRKMSNGHLIEASALAAMVRNPSGRPGKVAA